MRLIPAHAGKTASLPTSRATVWAHPRSRGENAKQAGQTVATMGSSPLTRGKPLGPASGLALFGLIPAHAGKTQFIGASVTANGAHPRSRGENFAGVGDGCVEVGSSPLTRGKRASSALLWALRGLIPAHAGKTPFP